MSQSNNIDTVQQYIPLAAATAGTAADLFVVYTGDGKAKAEAIYYVSDGGVTAHASNFATFTATVAGTSVGAITTEVTGSGNIADGATQALTMSGEADNLLSAGEAVKVAITKDASGVAISGGMAVAFRRVRAD